MLLFAIVPIALVIAMKNLSMFRDVFLYLIPVALTCQVLQVGQLVRADYTMSSDAINKHDAIVGQAVSAPSSTVLVIAIVLIVGSIAWAAWRVQRGGTAEAACKAVLYFGGGGAALLLLSSFVLVRQTVYRRRSRLSAAGA